MATGLNAVEVLTVYRTEDAAIAEVDRYGRRIQIANHFYYREATKIARPDAQASPGTLAQAGRSIQIGSFQSHARSRRHH